MIILTYSRRCSGVLSQILSEMEFGTLSNDSWYSLQKRVLTHPSAKEARQQVRAGDFAGRSCRAGVLRHDVRAGLVQHRELQHAAAANSSLFVAVAADRCTDKTCPRILTRTDYLELLEVANLNTTKQLQGYLFLYEGMTVVLEEKLCRKIGLVRGCGCIVRRILFDRREPNLSNGEPGQFHVLHYVPEALILQVPEVAWVKDPLLGPGCFYLPARRRSWTAHLKGSGACTLTVERLQIPVTNDSAGTAYSLQGQTLDRGIFVLNQPGGMSRDELWISLYVLLSRTPSLECTVLLALPPRDAFDGGPPAFLRQEMTRLRALEAQTLRRLHADLLKWGLPRRRSSNSTSCLACRLPLPSRESSSSPVSDQNGTQVLVALTLEHRETKIGHMRC